MTTDPGFIAGPPTAEMGPNEDGSEIRGADFEFRLIGGRFTATRILGELFVWSAPRAPYPIAEIDAFRRNWPNAADDRFFAALDDRFLPQRACSADFRGKRIHVLEWDCVDGATPTFRSAVFDADGVFWVETFLEDAAYAPTHPLPDFTPILRVIEKFLGGK